jgi:hypothetical protein
VCYNRPFARHDEWRQLNKPEEDLKFVDEAQRHLFPAYLMNSLSLVVALGGFVMWLFCSPHVSMEEAARLDRASGSYFAFDLVANLLVTAGQMTVYASNSREIPQVLYIVLTFGTSIIGPEHSLPPAFGLES